MSNHELRLELVPNDIKGLKGKRDCELSPLYIEWLKLKVSKVEVEEWYAKLFGTDEELIWACNNIPIELEE
jgi:hypothetical protein